MMINAIVAIGTEGQIGLDGRLPWKDLDDLAWFAKMTSRQILIAGHNTRQTLPELPGRTVLIDDVSMHPLSYAAQLGVDVWVIGGAKTYARWAPYIDRWHIGKIDYYGPADAWFDPSWLLAKGRNGI